LSIAQDIPTVWANANRLFQAFVELIENAMDAMEENGGGLLEISAQLRGEEILIRFSDTGPGIKDPLRVFDPFYTTKAVGKGTGLGLSAVYGVVQEHDGQITCQNKPQGGAVFILLLPMSTEPTAKAATAAF
jgi:signal transduction histidine kinase